MKKVVSQAKWWWRGRCGLFFSGPLHKEEAAYEATLRMSWSDGRVEDLPFLYLPHVIRTTEQVLDEIRYTRFAVLLIHDTLMFSDVTGHHPMLHLDKLLETLRPFTNVHVTIREGLERCERERIETRCLSILGAERVIPTQNLLLVKQPTTVDRKEASFLCPFRPAGVSPKATTR